MCGQYKSGHAPDAAFQRLLNGAAQHAEGDPQIGDSVRVITQGGNSTGHYFDKGVVGVITDAERRFGKVLYDVSVSREGRPSLRQFLFREDFELL